MSDASVAKLGAEVVKIMGAPDIDEKARTQGFRVDARGPQQFTPFLKDEIERWRKIIQTAGISVS
jgi:tripartite-type tricarboxylate transporter receptor subunit TctC